MWYVFAFFDLYDHKEGSWFCEQDKDVSYLKLSYLK